MSEITVSRGEDEVLNFSITDASSGEAVNITGGTVTFKVVSQPGGNTIIEKECEMVNASEGSCKAVLSDEDTDIINGIYDYELWLVDSGGQKVQVLPTSPFVVLSGSAPS